MGEEASVAVVARMYDETGPAMQQLASNTEQVQLKAISTTLALSALGSALSSVGSLFRYMDNPQAKMIANTLQIAAAVVLSATAFARLIPIIQQATAAMRSMAIIQSVLAALSGPGGWAMLGIGAAVGVGATAGIMRATRQSVTQAEAPAQPSILPGGFIARAATPQTPFPAGQLPGAGNVLEGRSIQGVIQKPASSQTIITEHYHIAGSLITEREVSDIVRKNIISTQHRNAGKSGIT